MRLNDAEIVGIISGIEPFITFGPVDLRLYGSRIDDSKKGGDIDLLLIVPFEAKEPMQDVKHKILSKIKQNLGDRKIDLLICAPSSLETDPFIAFVFPSSISLKVWEKRLGSSGHSGA